MATARHCRGVGRFPSFPGLGLTLLNAAQVEDIPLYMGALTIVGVLTLISHLIVDVGYAFLDPRIRYS